MFVLTGWLDESSPAQALFRYRTFSNPQDLIIGPFTHGGFQSDDPFLPEKRLDMTYQKQTELMADFFDPYLKGDAVGQREKTIRVLRERSRDLAHIVHLATGDNDCPAMVPGDSNTLSTAAAAQYDGNRPLSR